MPRSPRPRRSRHPRRSAAHAWATLAYAGALLVPGALLVLCYIGFDLPLAGLSAYDTYREDSDQMMRLVGTVAAMREPIDWGAPIALASVNAPDGSTLVYIDGMPAVTMALRLAAQAGVWIDPAAVLSGILVGALVAATAAAAAVARAFGADRPTALIAGALIPWLAPLVWFANQYQHSILPWMPVAIVVAATVGVERGRRFSAIAMAAALIAWWIHAYHGAMVSLTLLLTIAFVFRRAPQVTVLRMAAAAILPPLSLVVLGGMAGVSDGGMMSPADLSGIATFFDTRIIGLPILPDEEIVFAWGILLPVAAVIGGRLLLRTAPAAAAVALLSALIATGTLSGGGLVPDLLFQQIPPIGIFRYTDRFALLTALILFGAAAATCSAWIARARSRHFGQRRRAAVLMAGAAVFIAQVASFAPVSDWLSGPGGTYDSYPAALAAADQELLRAHERLHPEPFHDCTSHYDETARARLGMEAQFNLSAASMGVPSTSMQVVRYPTRDCATGLPVLSGDLLLLIDPAIVPPAEMPCIPLVTRLTEGIGIRVCSAQRAALERYADQLEALNAAGE